MATEEIEISQLELAEDLAPDMVLPVETTTNTKATTLQKIKEWLSGFFVKTSGDQTISGVKIFGEKSIEQQNNSFIKGNTGFSSDIMLGNIPYKDKNGNAMVADYNYIRKDGKTAYTKRLWLNTVDGGYRDTINTYYSLDEGMQMHLEGNDGGVFLSTPPLSDASSRGATTGWVNTELANKKVMAAPDYAKGISTTEETYTCPDDGWLYVVMLGNSEANTEGFAYINGSQVGYIQSKQQRSFGDSSIFIPVSKGDILTFSGNIRAGITKIFYPFK